MRCLVLLIALVCFSSLSVQAQSWTFTHDGVDYVLELPSPTWRVISRLDVHDHVDFVNGNDETAGYLRVGKHLVNAGTTPFDLFQFEEKWRLQELPGYVVCGDCKGAAFSGRLNGATFSYEYISVGKVMTGRIYYLQVDQRTFYSLRFTVAQDRFKSIEGQMETIARSFRVK